MIIWGHIWGCKYGTYQWICWMQTPLAEGTLQTCRIQHTKTELNHMVSHSNTHFLVYRRLSTDSLHQRCELTSRFDIFYVSHRFHQLTLFIPLSFRISVIVESIVRETFLFTRNADANAFLWIEPFCLGSFSRSFSSWASVNPPAFLVPDFAISDDTHVTFSLRSCWVARIICNLILCMKEEPSKPALTK